MIKRPFNTCEVAFTPDKKTRKLFKCGDCKYYIVTLWEIPNNIICYCEYHKYLYEDLLEETAAYKAITQEQAFKFQVLI